MAASIMKEQANKGNAGLATWKYTLRRISAFAVPYYIFLTANFILDGISKWHSVRAWIASFFKVIPTYLFMTSTGFECSNLITGAWYISSMVISLLLLYPLIYKLREQYIYSIAPIFSGIILGFLSRTSNGLGGVTKEYGIFTKGLFWGLMCFNLGIFVYSSSVFLAKNQNKLLYILLNIASIIAIAFVILFAAHPSLDSSYGYVMTIVLAFFILIELSIPTYLNKILSPLGFICSYLRKLSLYIYLDQMFIKNLVGYIAEHIGYPDYSNWLNIIFPIIVAIISMPLYEERLLCCMLLTRNCSSLTSPHPS